MIGAPKVRAALQAKLEGVTLRIPRHSFAVMYRHALACATFLHSGGNKFADSEVISCADPRIAYVGWVE